MGGGGGGNGCSLGRKKREREAGSTGDNGVDRKKPIGTSYIFKRFKNKFKLNLIHFV